MMIRWRGDDELQKHFLRIAYLSILRCWSEQRLADLVTIHDFGLELLNCCALRLRSQKNIKEQTALLCIAAAGGKKPSPYPTKKNSGVLPISVALAVGRPNAIVFCRLYHFYFFFCAVLER